MAWKDWDDREYWEDSSKCIVCKASMGNSEALICSATCEDIWLLRSEKENDCYA